MPNFQTKAFTLSLVGNNFGITNTQIAWLVWQACSHKAYFFSCAHVKFIAGNLGRRMFILLSSYDILSLFND